MRLTTVRLYDRVTYESILRPFGRLASKRERVKVRVMYDSLGTQRQQSVRASVIVCERGTVQHTSSKYNLTYDRLTTKSTYDQSVGTK